jgi:hypothetical protein
MNATQSWAGPLLLRLPCFAAADVPAAGIPHGWELFFFNLAQAVVYVVVGLGLFGVAYLIIDKVTPFSLRKELIEDRNQALAIVLGSVFISIALILAAAIRG